MQDGDLIGEIYNDRLEGYVLRAGNFKSHGGKLASSPIEKPLQLVIEPISPSINDVFPIPGGQYQPLTTRRIGEVINILFSSLKKPKRKVDAND